MPMEHKAFAFDYAGFESELSPILLDALETGDVATLRGFIDSCRVDLTDPYEGEPLPSNWEAEMPAHGVQEYADFALTKFYDPAQSIGLDAEWEELGELLQEAGSSEALILGTPLGSEPDRLFDPGCSGSYFQTPSDVAENCSKLEQLAQAAPTLRSELEPVLQMLRKAREARCGLYVTF